MLLQISCLHNQGCAQPLKREAQGASPGGVESQEIALSRCGDERIEEMSVLSLADWLIPQRRSQTENTGFRGMCYPVASADSGRAVSCCDVITGLAVFGVFP